MPTIIYRPSQPISQEFFNHLDEFLGYIFLKFTKFIICGDINIHLDDPKDPHTVQFNDIIASYGFQQFVQQTTHEKGHMLDVVIASHAVIDPNVTVIHSQYTSSPNCDHYPILFNLAKSVKSSINIPKIIKFRNIKAIDNPSFSKELSLLLMTYKALKSRLFHKCSGI